MECKRLENYHKNNNNNNNKNNGYESHNDFLRDKKEPYMTGIEKDKLSITSNHFLIFSFVRKRMTNAASDRRS